ncbi:MAG: hypothetical protein WAU45_10535 [Blastocatellia bacterium]
MATTSITRRGGAVRLTLSAKVANDLGALQKSLKLVAERLGHPACATGCDILHMGLEQEFASGDTVSLNPQPLPPRGHGLDQARGPITVTLPDKVSGNIDALTRAVGVVVGKLGCSACCSGFDILFRREINTLALDEKGGVARFGGLS